MYLMKINSDDVTIERDRGAKDRWEFYTDKRKKWRWRRYSTRNQIVGASGHGYDNRRQCETNAARHGCSS